MRLRNIPEADAAVTACPYVIANPASLRGNWSDKFENENPIHIEVGMGKGQFLFGQANAHPDINYIGIERYTSVLFRAIQKIDHEHPPKNLLFICMDAAELPTVFAQDEISRIYLNFSDPWPKDRHAKRRLTSHEFLERYDKILRPSGTIEFKTDNQALFAFSLEEIAASPIWEVTAHTFDLHHTPELCAGNIMTEYEQKFSSKGNPICKLIAARKA
jgi:tRNA (guanine-N7-)-methyltransferase